MAQTWRLTTDPIPPDQAFWPARVSIPMPRGSELPDGFTVEEASGRRTPAQHRVLVPWPDESPRWVQLDYQASTGGAATVHAESTSEAVHKPVEICEIFNGWEVCVGDLAVTLDMNCPSFITRLAFRGQSLVEDGSSFQFTVTSPAGERVPLNEVWVDSVEVEASGPLRFTVRFGALHVIDRKTTLAAVCRLEFLAGVEGFSFSYQFIHQQEKLPTMELQEIKSTFGFPGLGKSRALAMQKGYSDMGLFRVVDLDRPLALKLDKTRTAPYAESAEAIDDDYTYSHFMRYGNTNMGPAVATRDEEVAVIAMMRDFATQRPKTLTIKPGGFEVDIWPQWAGTLELPQGRSCRQVFCFLFARADSPLIESELTVQRCLKLEPVSAWLNHEDSACAGKTWVQPKLLDSQAPGAGLVSYVLSDFTANMQTVHEMFHYGDYPEVGYMHTYAGVGHMPVDTLPELRLGPDGAHWAFHPGHDLGTVWTNNEYDTIYCLALQAMRTRSAKTLELFKATARHQIEVDFIHYSDSWQQHRGTPAHTYNHTGCSSVIPSHQWTQGLYYYYVLTGDDDALEVINGICEYNLRYFANPELDFIHFFNRELGWATIAYVFGYEATGSTCYIEAAEELLKELEGYSGRTNFEDILHKFSSAHSGNARMIGQNFNMNTVPLGCAFYHQATDDPWARELLIEWTELGLANYNDRSTGPKIFDLFPEILTYVWELTGDDELLRDALWHLTLYMLGHRTMGTIAGDRHPTLNGKQYARIYRGVQDFASACSRAGLLDEVERRLLGEPPA